MRATHASAAYLHDGPPLPKAVKKEKFERGCMVKGRNEPVSLPRVAHVVAKVKQLPIEQVCEAYVLLSSSSFHFVIR
jgi:TatD DNase family protein